MSTSYALADSLGNIVTTDTPASILLLHDRDVQLERDSRARSGVYFETIATEIENTAALCDDRLVRAELERLTNELLYLQRRYLVIKKPSIIEQSDAEADSRL